MREIKFRAWDGELMYSVAELVFDMGPNLDGKGIRFYGPGVGEGRVDGENTILMQYTGLKDKNGKEIYEGDILRIKNDHLDETVVFKVEWGGEDYPAFYLPGYETEMNSFSELYYGEDEFKVIGNIYENPELLEGAG